MEGVVTAAPTLYTGSTNVGPFACNNFCQGKGHLHAWYIYYPPLSPTARRLFNFFGKNLDDKYALNLNSVFEKNYIFEFRATRPLKQDRSWIYFEQFEFYSFHISVLVVFHKHQFHTLNKQLDKHIEICFMYFINTSFIYFR